MSLTLSTLPDELKLKIFRYLLRGDHMTRKYGQRTSYQYETAILRVSRGMHEVAHDVLYKENAFLQIHNTTSNSILMLKRFQVPIVSVQIREERFFAATQFWQLTLDIRDIDVLVRALRILLAASTLIRYVGGPKRKIARLPTGYGTPLWITTLGDACDTVQLNDSTNTDPSAALAKQELLKLGKFPGIRLKSILKGERQFAEMKSCNKLIWPEAMAWDMIDAISSWKEELDDLVRQKTSPCSCEALAGASPNIENQKAYPRVCERAYG